MTDHLIILHLEDNPADAALVEEILHEGGIACEMIWVKTAKDFQAALKERAIDLIISDFALPTFDGMSALKFAQEQFPETPFVFVSGTMGEEVAVESLKQGATDYVLKDRLIRLGASVKRATQEARERAERKRAEEKIHEQAALLDKAQDAIIVRDLEDCIIYWNKSAERLYGWTAAEANGRNVNELLLAKDAPQLDSGQKEFMERGEWMGEVQQVTKDRKPVMVESRWTLVRDGAGQPKAKLVINTDITEKKKLEAQFLRAQRMESIGALAGGIAHDLNNALVPILMGVELLRDDLPGEMRSKMLDTMKSSALRGSEMITQILAFARGVSGELAVLNVKHLITEMNKLAKETFPRSIQIQTKTAKNLYPVTGNATQLHQVLLNLCVNARDAMPAGGSLQIEADNIVLHEKITCWKLEPVSGPHLVLTVSDTGQGMSPEVLQRIFEPFFTTKEIGRGTGLGLSTVQGIIKSHNGFMEVESQIGRGTTFKVYLAAAPTAKLQSSETKPSDLPLGKGEQILVVDDDLAILEIMRETLETFGYRALTAKDGVEAVALYQRHSGEIHAVITDMMMPVMDGPTTIHALQEVDPLVKVIGVSGLGSEEVLSKAGKLQVQAFLKKPCTCEELLSMLQRVLHGNSAALRPNGGSLSTLLRRENPGIA